VNAPMEYVGHVNSDGNMTGIRRLANHKANPVGIGSCEMSRVGTSRLDAALDGYVPFFGGQGHPSPRARDTVVYRRDGGTTHLGTMGLRTSRTSTPEKVAGLPRFVSGTLFRSHELDMQIAFWELHNHWAGPAADDPQADRIEATDEGMWDFRTLLRAMEQIGFANVVVGDINVPHNTPTPGWLSPWEVFEDLKMSTFAQHIDGAGVSPRLRIEDKKTFTREEMDSDHPGFLLGLVKA
jgi:hypothetical protein